MTPEFAEYQKSIKANASVLSEELSNAGMRIVSGGTENHMVLVDVTPLDLTGRQAEEALGKVGIVVNRNAIPYDPKPPRTASGMRLGTPAITSRGLGIAETAQVAQMITRTLTNVGDESVERSVGDEVLSLTERFPVPGIDA